MNSLLNLLNTAKVFKGVSLTSGTKRMVTLIKHEEEELTVDIPEHSHTTVPIYPNEEWDNGNYEGNAIFLVSDHHRHDVCTLLGIDYQGGEFNQMYLWVVREMEERPEKRIKRIAINEKDLEEISEPEELHDLLMKQILAVCSGKPYVAHLYPIVEVCALIKEREPFTYVSSLGLKLTNVSDTVRKLLKQPS